MEKLTCKIERRVASSFLSEVAAAVAAAASGQTMSIGVRNSLDYHGRFGGCAGYRHPTRHTNIHTQLTETVQTRGPSSFNQWQSGHRDLAASHSASNRAFLNAIACASYFDCEHPRPAHWEGPSFPFNESIWQRRFALNIKFYH